jgi:type IV pilus assembly protein PilV
MITPRRFTAGLAPRSRGFTLLEVMVSLIIISIGLLGIAKIHALAYSSTAAASTRSLVALQAAGLASSMHADRTYWGFGVQPATVNITGAFGGAFAIDDAGLNTPANCYFPAPACTPDVMAAFDLQNYGTALSAALPNSQPKTTITCAVVNQPVTCTILVTWSEKQVAVNKEGTAAPTFPLSYMLYVEP